MKNKLEKILKKGLYLSDMIDIMHYALASYAEENDSAYCLYELIKLIKDRYNKLYRSIDEVQLEAYKLNEYTK